MNRLTDDLRPFAPVLIKESDSVRTAAFPIIEVFSFFSVMLICWLVFAPAENELQTRFHQASGTAPLVDTPEWDTTRNR